MRALIRRAWAWSALAAVLAACLFACFLALGSEEGLAAALHAGPQVLLVAAVGFGTAVSTAALSHWHYRRAIRDLGRHVAAFRIHPTVHPLTTSLADPITREVLGPLLDPLETLCSAYRQALGDRVAQGETMASLRSLLERSD